MPEVPGKPVFGVCLDQFGIFVNGQEIFVRVFSVHATGLNEGHEDVSNEGAILGFVKQGIFSVNDGFFQSPFADVVVKGRSRNFQEPG